MKLSSSSKKFDEVDADVLVVAGFDSNDLEPVDGKFEGVLKDFFATCTGLKQWRLVPAGGKIKAKYVLIINAGKKEKASLESLRKLAGFTVRKVRDQGFKSFATLLTEIDIPGTSPAERAQAVAEGVILGNYRFDKYKTLDKEKRNALDHAFIISNEKDAVEKGKILAECACLCRDLQNECPSVLTPESFAEEAKKLEEFGVKVTVFDKKKCEEEGLRALLAVNRGSVNEPRFVIMEYNGGGKKVALVGKGITFDSGGLDIKPAEAMLDMKMDMSGAGVVLSTMKAAALLELPVNLIGVFAATENMLGENAYKQGDVVKAYNGKTIEILHTDAEGRVVLADALSYTEKNLKPDVVVDLATLTGACVVALGSFCAGVMGRDDSQSLISQLLSSGAYTGERLWQLPFWQDYHELVKADHADVQNIGKVKKQAGAITAGTFLSAFVEKTPWAHIDIAGPAWSEKSEDYFEKGGTGFGVRMLTDFLEKFK